MRGPVGRGWQRQDGWWGRYKRLHFFVDLGGTWMWKYIKVSYITDWRLEHVCGTTTGGQLTWFDFSRDFVSHQSETSLYNFYYAISFNIALMINLFDEFSLHNFSPIHLITHMQTQSWHWLVGHVGIIVDAGPYGWHRNSKIRKLPFQRWGFEFAWTLISLRSGKYIVHLPPRHITQGSHRKITYHCNHKLKTAIWSCIGIHAHLITLIL